LKSIEHDGIFSPAMVEGSQLRLRGIRVGPANGGQDATKQRNQWNSLTLDRTRPHIAHLVSYNF